MKYSFCALAVAMMVCAAGSAARASDPLMAPIARFLGGFNTGNEKLVMSAVAPAGVQIVDDIPPFAWTGPQSMKTWAHDLAVAEKKASIVGIKVTLGAPQRELSSGSRAYVVVPSVYAFTDHGKPMHDTAHMAFALQKIAGKWLIVGWTWSGSTPQSG